MTWKTKAEQKAWASNRWQPPLSWLTASKKGSLSILVLEGRDVHQMFWVMRVGDERESEVNHHILDLVQP